VMGSYARAWAHRYLDYGLPTPQQDNDAGRRLMARLLHCWSRP
jgi:hypothetical protein